MNTNANETKIVPRTRLLLLVFVVALVLLLQGALQGFTSSNDSKGWIAAENVMAQTVPGLSIIINDDEGPGRGPICPGYSVHFDIIVTNNVGVSLNDVIVTVQLAPGTQAIINSDRTTPPPTSYDSTTNIVTWNLGTLAQGQTVLLQLLTRTLTGFPPNTSFSTVATVTGRIPNSVPGIISDSDTETTTVSDCATATPEPSMTATATMTATETTEPTATMTPTATETEEPATVTPTATETEEPTVTPTATETEEPTVTPTPTATETETVYTIYIPIILKAHTTNGLAPGE